MSKESEHEVNDIIWESSCVQHQHIIINAKSLWEIWSKDFHQRRRRNKENHDNNNKEHSEMSERNWRRWDVVDAQKHRDDEKIIKIVDILNQDKEQQENIEEKWFLNQRDIIEHMFMQDQFWSSDTWN